MQIRLHSGKSQFYFQAGLAVSSGVLLGLSFPPADLSWLVWIALVPMLWATTHADNARSAFIYGLISAVIFYLITIYPATSAHSWSGWQTAASEVEQSALVSQQQIRLFTLWILLPFWGGLFWGISTAILQKLNKASHWRIAIFAPPLFIVFTEWLRSKASYDYHWSFLGNAVVDTAGIIQLGSLGGVWLLSWLVILVNVAVLTLISASDRRDWKLLTVVASTFLGVMLWGTWHAKKLDELPSETEQLRVAAIQHHHADYTTEHYSAMGIERDYLELMHQVSTGEIGPIDILVLPESIAFAALSTDGTQVEGLPVEIQQPLNDWNESITWIINEGQPRPAIILGVETIENGRLFNSMTFWSPDGLEHVYHKQNLVPFAEFQPALLKFFDFSGEVQFTAGTESTVADVFGHRVGSFICQEVLTPPVIRNSVRNGAELLVSGGNDGVFANPAVAEVHAKLARLRAVESGRYIVRAMKTGVSAIISPSGREVSRSPGSDPYVVVGTIAGRSQMTLYSQLGDWPLLAALALLLAWAIIWRSNLRAESLQRNKSTSLGRRRY